MPSQTSRLWSRDGTSEQQAALERVNRAAAKARNCLEEYRDAHRIMVAVMADARAAGVSIAALARATAVTRETVYDWLRAGNGKQEATGE